MYFREITAVHFENNIEDVNTLCGTNIGYLGIIYLIKNTA
jgi:hypothetical protein